MGIPLKLYQDAMKQATRDVDPYDGDLPPCQDHHDSQPMSSQEITSLLANIYKATSGLGYIVQRHFPTSGWTWLEGLMMLTELIDEGDFFREDCDMCCFQELLNNFTLAPFLVGLKILGEEDLFERCLNGMEDWVEEIHKDRIRNEVDLIIAESEI